MSGTGSAHYVWWLAGRSAGMVALGLITASVLIGLAMAARILPPRWRRSAVAAHQHLALVSLCAIAAHGLLLASDPWLKPGISGVTVPFALAYRPVWTGLGIIAAYLAAIFVLSFYVRRRIGARTWRRLHRFTVVAYVLALAHTLGSGTDATIPAVRYALLATAVPVVALLALRLARERVATRARRAASAPPTTSRHDPARVRATAHRAAVDARLVAAAGRGGRLKPKTSDVL